VLEQLQNPEMAKAYLEVALEEYKEDSQLTFFLEALRNVVEARFSTNQEESASAV
jgi:DNA-binding phage protein